MGRLSLLHGVGFAPLSTRVCLHPGALSSVLLASMCLSYTSTVVSQLRENAVLHAQRAVPFLPAVGFGHCRSPGYTLTLFQPSAIFWKHCNLQGPVPEATTSFTAEVLDSRVLCLLHV